MCARVRVRQDADSLLLGDFHGRSGGGGLGESAHSYSSYSSLQSSLFEQVTPPPKKFFFAMSVFEFCVSHCGGFEKVIPWEI